MSLANDLLAVYPDLQMPDVVRVISAGGQESIEYWGDPRPVPTAAEMEAARLPQAKAKKLSRLRADAASRITAKWPLWAQNNCALGVYPDATVAQCAADIAAVVTASNTAEDAVTAATTVAEVEAVTATWPTL